MLDLKGTMSEAELHWLRLRLVGGRLNKARRGELRLTPPIGYVWRDGRFALDPNEAVQRAVRTVFERFAIEPTSWAVARWAQRTGIKFPTRAGPIDGSGELEWRALTMARVCALLHNPTYAGVYSYGKRAKRQVVVDGQIRTRTTRVATDQWAVRIVDAHPGYIDWETYVTNQERLRSNQSRMHGAFDGAPKNGPALLAGIILCGRCGRRMRVDYSTHERVSWRYVCFGKHDAGYEICWSVMGDLIDRELETAFLSAVVPEEIDLTIAVERETEAQAKSLQAQWQSRLDHARYEVRRAERRYKAVDPDHRVVARTLEREWEAKLQDLDEVERQYREAQTERHVELTASDRAALRSIARDLRAVWRAETTTAADRKAMLRLVVQMISLEPVDLPRRGTRVRIQWTSGAIDEHIIDRPANRTAPKLATRIQELLNSDDGLDNRQIAKRLNDEGALTAKRMRWTEDAVQHVRNTHGLRRPRRLHRSALPERHPDTGHYSIPGIAKRLAVTTKVVRGWVARGVIPAHQAHHRGYQAWWLRIDDKLMVKLERLAHAKLQAN
ncbi:MAG TPA: recombinase family protein [Gemmatimonadaceae bacterium]|nr:recombinase family protein [Gemmatimonadaceae bacterium]